MLLLLLLLLQESGTCDILEISSADALNSIATTASAIKSAVLAPIMCEHLNLIRFAARIFYKSI
jgi:hypothetical protein